MGKDTTAPSDGLKVGACPACGGEVLRAETPRRRRLLLDPEPHEKGNIVISDGHALIFNNPAGIAPRLVGKPRYQMHARACTNVDELRRREVTRRTSW